MRSVGCLVVENYENLATVASIFTLWSLGVLGLLSPILLFAKTLIRKIRYKGFVSDDIFQCYVAVNLSSNEKLRVAYATAMGYLVQREHKLELAFPFTNRHLIIHIPNYVLLLSIISSTITSLGILIVYSNSVSLVSDFESDGFKAIVTGGALLLIFVLNAGPFLVVACSELCWFLHLDAWTNDEVWARRYAYCFNFLLLSSIIAMLVVECINYPLLIFNFYLLAVFILVGIMLFCIFGPLFLSLPSLTKLISKFGKGPLGLAMILLCWSFYFCSVIFAYLFYGGPSKKTNTDFCFLPTTGTKVLGLVYSSISSIGVFQYVKNVILAIASPDQLDLTIREPCMVMCQECNTQEEIDVCIHHKILICSNYHVNDIVINEVVVQTPQVTQIDATGEAKIIARPLRYIARFLYFASVLVPCFLSLAVCAGCVLLLVFFCSPGYLGAGAAAAEDEEALEDDGE